MEEHRDYVQGTHTGVGVNVARVRRESRESKQAELRGEYRECRSRVVFVREIVACIFCVATS